MVNERNKVRLKSVLCVRAHVDLLYDENRAVKYSPAMLYKPRVTSIDSVAAHLCIPMCIYMEKLNLDIGTMGHKCRLGQCRFHLYMTTLGYTLHLDKVWVSYKHCGPTQYVCFSIEKRNMCWVFLRKWGHVGAFNLPSLLQIEHYVTGLYATFNTNTGMFLLFHDAVPQSFEINVL